ncbi:MAG TPA: RluA family pseudouridine synthase [Candidatus Saccharimonadales bacterium]|nr:RluA family pseudouridine synthase [Candidatus Saccharimonadales bacterium]
MINVTYEPMIFTADDRERLDVFLVRVLPEHSRSFVQKLARDGGVQVNDVPQTKSGAMLQGGETIIVMMPIPDLAPTGDMEVIYEDADVAVLNKPAGMLTHAKGLRSEEFTVGEYMRTRTTDGPETNRPGIVHRLDRDTSGVIITAKTPEAKRWLQKQFSTRKVKKTYLALVKGHPKEPTALIQLPIERNPKKPQMFRVGGNGKPAETTYETLASYKDTTYVQLKPRTGRTHQLRVHMHYLGCPIVGDPVYGSPEPKLGRMFLHAAELELTLPSRERKVFTVPLPAELQKYLDSLK